MRKNAGLCIAFAVTLTALLAVVPAQAGSREKVLYSFLENNNGAYPVSRLVVDSQGNLYGTTEFGGKDGGGVAFQLSPTPAGKWKFNRLHSFNPITEGSNPNSGLLLDKSGRLYGTTPNGGSGSSGTAFELTHGSGGWTYQVIHNFAGGSKGSAPSGELISDSQGRLYGTTGEGGSTNCNLGCGIAFQLRRTPSGKWKETVLYTFQGGTDGSGPLGTLVWDGAGNLYGETAQGGSDKCFFGCGTVFELSPTSQGSWQKKTLSAFANPKQGQTPYGGLTFDQAGNLYGTTFWGGDLACNSGGCGTVFKISPQGKETVLYRFGPKGTDGWNPMAGLVLGGDGRLYGTASAGGQFDDSCGTIGCGTVFAITTSGKLTTLHAFDLEDGADPQAGLCSDPAGHLYGTTFQGGAGFVGTVFEVTP